MTQSAQMVLDLPFRAAMGREDFWVSPSNRTAVAWIDRWPDWPTPLVILNGPAASGKTHLLKVWQARASADAWAVDDADLTVGDAAAEEDMFHRFNRLKEEGGTALMTASLPPAQWAIALPDLRSRLMAQTAVPIEPPDDDLLQALIVKSLADRQLEAGPDAVKYLLARVERSFHAVQDLIERADRLALARKKPITVPLLRELLEEENG